MNLIAFVLFLSASLFFSATQDQVQLPILHPEVIAGPWETASATTIDGVFFQFVTGSSGPSADPQVAWQTIDVRVYHRQQRKETGGWFSTVFKAAPESSDAHDASTRFDGQRLRINFGGTTDLKPFDLDITFSPTEQTWTGTWSRSGHVRNVVLERPSANGVFTPSNFIGDCQGDVTTSNLPSPLKSPAIAPQATTAPALAVAVNVSAGTVAPTGRNIRFERPPPGAGVPTVIQPVPLVAVSAAGTVAVNFTCETYVVVSAVVPQYTVELNENPAPVTVSVNNAPPGVTDTGAIACTNGIADGPHPPALLGIINPNAIKNAANKITIPWRNACRCLIACLLAC